MEVSFSSGNDTSWAISNFSKWEPEVSQAMAGVSAATSFSIHVTPVHTYSKGTVRLGSGDPFEYPLVDPNLLGDADKKDIRTLHEGIKLSLRLIETPALKAIDAKLAVKPLAVCNQTVFLSDEYWLCAIPYISNHNNHPVSTCKMGPDPTKGAVVNHQLKVHGIKNLRVADNSVIPLSTTAHLNALAYLIGERGAALIKQEYNIL